jgi:hypothetical protein
MKLSPPYIDTITARNVVGTVGVLTVVAYFFVSQ